LGIFTPAIRAMYLLQNDGAMIWIKWLNQIAKKAQNFNSLCGF